MDIIKYLKSEGYSEIREINSKGICGLMDFMFTTGLVIGMNEIGYFGRYCYKTRQEALDALNKWDGSGDPPGNWIKYKGTGGERENLNGINECLNCFKKL
jgi:hypothetical protein